MSESDVDTSRTAVRTYVPAYQREEWDEHADELGMSRSEFVRTMVQAGRRGFDGDEAGNAGPAGTETPSETDSEGASSSADSGGSDLEDRVVEALRSGDYLSWDELLEAVTDDIEAGLEDALQTLQSDGRVAYSGRNGGYTIDE
ncbi:hypothetical protein C475_13227 [Halosimplex carlsbadense 2-9-1]|uniref:Uncharacterized protein n=1 Tax=Halosimplex carlsbadense 2-9-1 TaxID=797114 RepID=M0CNK5_9EURY|nr:DUF5805 domain-containing protein [Halosimplex carlsbadense]ELZ24213.1 hypothetical protein C475_13227 [Halosimplex carlsbadense 2-9-1]